MPDGTYQPKTYEKQGGDEIVIASGGKITVEAGGDIDTAGVGIFDGADPKNVADANLVGGIPVLHRFDVAAGATLDIDFVLTYKTRVVDAWLVKTTGAGGGAGTIQVKNAANAITDAMSINIADQLIARAASIDDAAHEIAAGGTLRIARVRTASTNEACTVYVLGVRVA